MDDIRIVIDDLLGRGTRMERAAWKCNTREEFSAWLDEEFLYELIADLE
jgi:hypothetical protein